MVGTEDASVGRFQTPEQVVSLAFRELDRRDTPPSVVSGKANAITAKLVGFMPRRVALAISGRVLA